MNEVYGVQGLAPTYSRLNAWHGQAWSPDYSSASTQNDTRQHEALKTFRGFNSMNIPITVAKTLARYSQSELELTIMLKLRGLIFYAKLLSSQVRQDRQVSKIYLPIQAMQKVPRVVQKRVLAHESSVRFHAGEP